MDIVIVLHDFQQTHIPFTVLGVSRTLVWRNRETRCRTPRARAALHATRAEGNIPRCKVYTTAASATIAGDCECERLDVTLGGRTVGRDFEKEICLGRTQARKVKQEMTTHFTGTHQRSSTSTDAFQ